MSTRLSFLAGTLLTLAATLWLAVLIAGTPPVIVLSAAMPAGVYLGAITLSQRREGRPASLLLASVLWGVTGAAFLSHSGNELARRWIEVLAGPHARAVTATLAAPVIEEAAKATGLLLLIGTCPKRIATVRDGVVYGALIGIGFVLTENLIYLGFAALEGGESGLARGVYLRAVLAGGDHAVFTGTIGAGIGRARAAVSRRERIPPLTFAVVAALAQHLAWNAIASRVIGGALCGAATAGGACRPTPAATDLFIVVPLVVAMFLGPGAAALVFLYRRGSELRGHAQHRAR